MSMDATVINELFLQKTASADGIAKAAEEMGAFVQDRLREEMFAGKILTQKTVTRADCQVSENHDTLVKVVELEPRSRAMVMSFRGEPGAEIIRADRVFVGFVNIMTPMFQRTEEELMAYSFPITKVVEDNSLKDMEEVVDREFILHGESAVQALQTEANGSALAFTASAVRAGTVIEEAIVKGERARNAITDTMVVNFPMRPDFVRLFNLVDGRRLRLERVLMGETDFNGLLTWTAEDLGANGSTETAFEGWKSNLLLGRSYVRTIKTDILRPGNIYGFTKENFLGRHYLLNAAKFYIDKKANVLSFQAWMNMGMCFVNIAAIRKLELYSGDANPSTASANNLARVTAVSESQIGAPNNKVDKGLRFPAVPQY